MTLLNLGCGLKTSSTEGVINIDRSAYLVIKKSTLLSFLSPLILNKRRQASLRTIPDNVIVHDLRQGIPFRDESVQYVYHSHFLEHIDRHLVPGFLRENFRVLKSDGIVRIVVPDFQRLCTEYLDHLDASKSDVQKRPCHDQYISRILEQSVRTDAWGSKDQYWWRRFFENLLLGDARGRGETHQWMYDEVNLAELLTDAGFRDVCKFEYLESRIPDWNKIGLDLDSDGRQYKKGSLYLEARK